jgi:hypothetical protein
MSQFSFPRIHIKGGFYFNAGTANNDSIDPGDSGTDVCSTEAVQPMLNGMTDDEFIRWMQQLDPSAPPDKPRLRCQWNYYGDMSFQFTNVKVNSVQLSSQETLTTPEQDSLIGTEVTVNNAFMLDLNPEGFSTSQLFCDSIAFKGTEAALGAQKTFYSRKPSKACTRWINWYRNLSFHGLANSSGAAGGVAATFQMAMPVCLEDLDADAANLSDNILMTQDSQSLKCLLELLRSGLADGSVRGLMMRFNLYLAYPKFSDVELAEIFAQGIGQENGAYGHVVGTIAPWYADEMESITLGRYLNSAAPYAPHPGRNAFLAPAVAQVNREQQVVSLDLANTFPEDGEAGVKFDMGEVSLQVASSRDGTLTHVGNITYDQATYEQCSGMVDIPYDPALEAALEEGFLCVTSSKFPGQLLREEQYMAATDDSCSYLNEKSDENRQISIRMVEKGRPLSADTQLVIEQWQFTPTVNHEDPAGPPLPPRLLSQNTFMVPQTGELPFTLETLNGSGVRIFRLIPPEMNAAPMPDIITDYMAAARVLPHLDYSRLPDEDLTFDVIYREIFRYYYLIFPGMNKRLDMKDVTIWNTPTAAEYILKRSAKEMWHSYYYMPRTRDLSDGRRDLLHRWCRKVIREGTVPEFAEAPNR